MKNKPNKRNKSARRPDYFWFVNGNLKTGPRSAYERDARTLPNVTTIGVK